MGSAKRRIRLSMVMALGALATSPQSALAGGFGVREQSTEFQGMSFAGNATSGGGLSGMYWNPAVAAYAPAGLYTESHYAGIFGDVEIMGRNQFGTGRADSGNIAKGAAVPASYMSYRLNDSGIYFEYRMVIRTTDPNAAGMYADALRAMEQVREFRISPTGD